MLTKLVSSRVGLKKYNLCFARQVNFQSRNPPDPHFDRKRMVEICKPIYFPKIKPEWETCKKITQLEEPAHPYEVILANELTKNWEESRMILFYNLTALTGPDEKEIRNTFYKKDLYFHTYTSDVVQLALKNTSYTPVLHLFESKTALLFGAEMKIDLVLKLSRKLPQISLMAGLVDDVFYSRNQLMNLNETLKRDVHQELAQFLDYLPSQMSRTINYPTQMLCHNLSALQDDKKE